MCQNFFNTGSFYRKQHVGNTKENEIKELKPMKAYKHLRVEENHNMEHKNEKEKLKEDYVRSLRLIFNTELSAKNNMLVTGSLAVPVLSVALELLTGIKKKYKNWIEKQEKY
jgi:hypothetical protein